MTLKWILAEQGHMKWCCCEHTVPGNVKHNDDSYFFEELGAVLTNLGLHNSPISIPVVLGGWCISVRWPNPSGVVQTYGTFVTAPGHQATCASLTRLGLQLKCFMHSKQTVQGKQLILTWKSASTEVPGIKPHWCQGSTCTILTQT